MTLRQYQPVWDSIKTSGRCEIAANKVYHPRIKKAVVKEKDMDLGYKLECSEMKPPKRGTLKSNSVGSKIIFTLNISEVITIDSV